MHAADARLNSLSALANRQDMAIRVAAQPATSPATARNSLL